MKAINHIGRASELIGVISVNRNLAGPDLIQNHKAMTTKTDKAIEQRLAQQMPGTWPTLSEISRLACILAYAIGDRDGYEEGFTTCQLAAQSIVEAQARFDAVDKEMEQAAPAPPIHGLASTTKPGCCSSIDGDKILNDVLDTLSHIPGSGYEYVERPKS